MGEGEIMTEDELREKAVEYLLKAIEDPRKKHEFTAKELADILGKNPVNVYQYMDGLVREKKWSTRIAFDPHLGRKVKVWWLVEPE
jgi:predicted ArsR family transcriptional regulator